MRNVREPDATTAAPTIERIDLGCASNPMRVLIRLTAPAHRFRLHQKSDASSHSSDSTDRGALGRVRLCLTTLSKSDYSLLIIKVVS